MSKHILSTRQLLAGVTVGAVLAGSVITGAGKANATPDPYMPIPPVWCPGGGTQNAWGGWCDGKPFRDNTKWHMDSYWAPFVGRVWNPIVCVVADAPSPPPLAGPGGCGGAV